MDAHARPGPSAPLLIVAMALPMAGFALLLGVPSLDVHREHHPSHFWLVFRGRAGQRWGSVSS